MKSHAQIRAVGAGHSFSALARTVLLNLDHLKGMLAFDEAEMQCTVQAGTRLEDLGEYLAPINQALLNQGDINQQSLAELQCALWIATPVLKVLCHSQLPGLELLNHFLHQYKALFVYGGYWQAGLFILKKASSIACMAAVVIRKCCWCRNPVRLIGMIMYF